MDIGHRIKELRIFYGLTQQELADRLELSKGFISQLERNLTSPSVGTLLDVIQILGTTPAEFFADGAKMEGEIKSTGTVKIGRGSRIIGNIKASCAVIAGALKGDIDVQGPVVIDATAVIKGNIKSRSVQINNGAVIEGFCSQCYANTGVEDIFGKEEADDVSGEEEIENISGVQEVEDHSGEEKEE